MGLDMYFYLRKEKNTVATTPKEIADVFKEKCDSWQIVRDDTEIGYFRKFNALHKWIINNCADGVDDCQEIYLSEADIENLKGIVEDILVNNDLARDLLPTGEGFFFGSTEYDEYYFKDLEQLKQLMDGIIEINKDKKLDDKYKVVYQASW